MQKTKKLTPKEALFVREYLCDLNASAAYLRAGYKTKNPDVNGNRLLVKAGILNEIKHLLSKKMGRLDITAERILAELARVAFFDLTKIVTCTDGKMKVCDTEQMDINDRCAISELSEDENKYGVKWTVKAHNKLKALELLGKHLALFNDTPPEDESDALPVEITFNLGGSANANQSQ